MLFFKLNLVSFLFLGAAVASLDFDKYEKKKLVYGEKSIIKAHPYQVWLLIISTYTNVTVSCGGIIISKRFIMTAAHCFGKGASNIEVRAGSTLNNKDYTLIRISKAIKHPEYTPEDLNRDVALLKTRRPIKFTNTIKAIRLPARGRPMVEGTMITVSGWGLTQGGHTSDSLMAVEIPVANFNRCAKQYSNAYRLDLTENMWCGGYFDGEEKSACEGDSGGPAVQNGMVVGIVSFGLSSSCTEGPGVYTNVAAPDVRDFITKYTGL